MTERQLNNIVLGICGLLLLVGCTVTSYVVWLAVKALHKYLAN